MSIRHLYNQWLSPQKWLERAGVRPAMQITIGMVMLASCALSLAEVAGFLPNEEEQAVHSRMAVADSASVQVAEAVGNEDSVSARGQLENIIQSRPDILSAALRRRDGYLLAHTARHSHFWNGAPAQGSDATHIRVPLYQQGKLWGEMEIAFAPVPRVRGGWQGWFRNPEVRLAGFLLTSLFLMYWIFLSRMLRVLDPSQAVPDRMQLLMDTLVEGMVILDAEERIVMTNHAFAQSTFESIARLIGKTLSSLNWVNEKGEPLLDAYPWKAVEQSDLPQRSVLMRLRIGNRHTRRLHVNAAPILDPHHVRRGVLVTFSDETITESQLQRLSQLALKMSNADAGVHELRNRLGTGGDEKLLLQMEQLTQSARELSGELLAANYTRWNRQVNSTALISNTGNQTDNI